MNRINEVIDMSNISKLMPDVSEIQNALELDLFDNLYSLLNNKVILFNRLNKLFLNKFKDINIFNFDVYSNNDDRVTFIKGYYYHQKSTIDIIIPKNFIRALSTHISTIAINPKAYEQSLLSLSYKIYNVLAHELTHHQQNIVSKGKYNFNYRHFDNKLKDEFEYVKSFIFYFFNDIEISANAYALAKEVFDYKNDNSSFEECLISDVIWYRTLKHIKFIWNGLSRNEKIFINKKMKELKKQYYIQLYNLQKSEEIND